MPISKRVRKILWLIAGIVVVLPIAILLVVFLQIDRIVQKGVEIGGKAALGVDTRLDSASVSLLGGSVELKGLNVANPAGFTSPSFVKANLIRVDISPAELRKKELHVQEITLDGPEFTYELKDGESNFGVLMDRLKSEEKPSKEEKKKEEGEPIKLKVDLVRITNAKVHVVMGGKNIEASLPEIEVRNIADKDGNAVPADQIVSAVIGKVGGSIEESVAGILKEGREMVEGLGNDLESAKEQIGKEAKGAKESLKKLFNR